MIQIFNSAGCVEIYGTQAGRYYFINDHLGTPQKIVNSNGNVVWAAAMFPSVRLRLQLRTVTNNLRFPGQYFDAESGLALQPESLLCAGFQKVYSGGYR